MKVLPIFGAQPRQAAQVRGRPQGHRVQLSTGRPRDHDHDLARSPATAEPGRATAGRLRSTCTVGWAPLEVLRSTYTRRKSRLLNARDQVGVPSSSTVNLTTREGLIKGLTVTALINV